MILTGNEIIREVEIGSIIISPFEIAFVNPNSYNYRLSNRLKVWDEESNSFNEVIIPEEGFILEANKMYLGATMEVIGSTKYAMSLIGRSSLGRLGLFLQCSANIGHIGAVHNWTLEIVACKNIRIYPYMRVGQVSFWQSNGTFLLYSGIYGQFNSPTESFVK